MSAQPYEKYECPCPECGCEESVDRGPYTPVPWLDSHIGPVHPLIHLLFCKGCGLPFDVGPAEIADEYQEACEATQKFWEIVAPRPVQHD